MLAYDCLDKLNINTVLNKHKIKSTTNLIYCFMNTYPRQNMGYLQTGNEILVLIV